VSPRPDEEAKGQAAGQAPWGLAFQVRHVEDITSTLRSGEYDAGVITLTMQTAGNPMPLPAAARTDEVRSTAPARGRAKTRVTGT
jgi:hypothetical protein